jgi:hypothetical protein
MGKLARGVTDLATVRPDLAAEWSPTLNGDVTPRDVMSGTNKKAWWLCREGHEWEADINHRNNGRGCPICSGQKVLPGVNDMATTHPDLAREWHPTENADLTPADVMAGTNKTFWWLCKVGHSWQASGKSRKGSARRDGSGCPYCFGKRVLKGFNDLATTDPELAVQWHPTKNMDLSPTEVARSTSKKVWWLCAQGHEWEAPVNRRTGGTGCPVCSGRSVLAGFNDLESTNPELAVQWHPTKNGDLKPRDVIAGTSKRVWWLCSNGHDWQASCDNRLRMRSGCPYCSGNSVWPGFNDLATTDPEIAETFHPTKNEGIDPTHFSRSSQKKAWWLCSLGHEWEAVIGSRASGNGCPICSGQRRLRGFNDLATTNPDLAAEWHPTKNGNATPHDVRSVAGIKAWWLCREGHEWEARIANRKRGRGCPVCSGTQVLAGYNDMATTNPELAAQWHPTKNGGLAPRDVLAGTRIHIWWICPLGHAWHAPPSQLTRGGGCAVCSRKQIEIGTNDLATTNPELAAQWHPTKNGELAPKNVLAGTANKAWWICGLGHAWQASTASRNAGAGCPYCSGHRVIPGVSDLTTTNPELAVQWHPTKNGNTLPGSVSSGSITRVWWLCGLGHEWVTTPNNRSTGGGCPVCAGKQVLLGFNDLATTNPDLAAEWHPTKNGDFAPRDVTTGSGRKVWWLCAKGHEWKASVNHRNQGNGCPGCAKYCYDQTAPGYLYLLRKDHMGLQQFGITNRPEGRLALHQKNGWELLSVMGPASGVWIVETETALGRFFSDKGILLPRDYPDKFDGYSESWHSDELSFSTCAEMLEALRDWET